jgi:hypothetical protein
MTTECRFTLSISSDLLREARVLAAQRGTSVSRMLSEELERLVYQGRAYDAARRRALARLERGWDLGWTPPASRVGLHER